MPEIQGSTATTIDIGGHTTRYHRAGSGSPVILLHGSGAGVSAESNWWLNMPVLAAHHDVIAPDLFGFGASDLSTSLSYGIELWADQVTSLIEELGLLKPILVGNSLGGWVTLDIARRHSKLLGGLVLMGTGGTPESATRLIRRHRGYEPGVEAMRELLTDFVYDPRHVTQELVNERFEASRAPGAQDVYALTTAARARDRKERPVDPADFAQLDLPVLLVHGKEDRIIPAESSIRLATVMPRADLHLIARCGHWSQIEHVETFNQLVLQFVAHVELHRRGAETPAT